MKDIKFFYLNLLEKNWKKRFFFGWLTDLQKRGCFFFNIDKLRSFWPEDMCKLTKFGVYKDNQLSL